MQYHCGVPLRVLQGYFVADACTVAPVIVASGIWMCICVRLVVKLAVTEAK